MNAAHKAYALYRHHHVFHWRCNKCGKTTPRHHLTTAEEMPPCHSYGSGGEWLCGGVFEPIGDHPPLSFLTWEKLEAESP